MDAMRSGSWDDLYLCFVGVIVREDRGKGNIPWRERTYVTIDGRIGELPIYIYSCLYRK